MPDATFLKISGAKLEYLSKQNRIGQLTIFKKNAPVSERRKGRTPP